ncbi:MAG: BMP family ABC transporter substrate-binding protein [Pyrodictiaceae archaeon]
MSTRRDFIKLLIAGVAGLAIGSAATYVAVAPRGPSGSATQTATRTVTATRTKTVTVTATAAKGQAKIKALWVYIGPIGDYGWTHAHHVGKENVDKMFGWLTTRHLEQVKYEEAYKRIKSILEEEKFDAVFFTSFGYMDTVKRLAKEYPDVKFYHCSGPWEEFRDLPNVSTYFVEFYQLYYLNGIAAGAVTETCRVGYVPAFLIPEVVRHINAFAMGAVAGAKLMGKCGGGDKLEIYVSTPLYNWFDPRKAQDYARSLIENYDVDVIAYTEDSTAILELAEKYWDEGKKVYSFSHYSNMYEYFKRQGKTLRSHLTGQVADWTPVYAYLLAKLYAGYYEKEDVWARLGDFVPIRWRRPISESRAGSPEGAAYLAPLNKKAIPPKALNYIMEKYEEMKELLFEPFTGPIKGYRIDSDGKPLEKPTLKVEEGRRLGRNELWTMNWFYEKITSLAG